MSGLASNRRAQSAVAVLVLAGAAAGINLRWLDVHRRGLPFDIDEAGYLQRAVLDGAALKHGVGGFVRVLRSGDPQAPLLPATAGVVRHLTGGGPYLLYAVPQVFYALAVVATYLLARHLMGRRWSVLSAGLVATVPGLIIASRQFEFAVPLTALLTATIAAQLAAGEFRSLPRSVIWGALLGITTLTRTQSLGLLPPLLLAGAVRLVITRAGLTAVRNALLGLATAALFSIWWYSASWHAVLKYLTDYGYGRQSAGYGPAHRPWTVAWWTARPSSLLNTVLLAPIAAALLICLAGLWWRVRAGRAPGRSPGALRRFLATDAATLVIVVVGDYLILSSTRNVGSYFALPLVPALVVLATSVAVASPHGTRRVAAVACVSAAALSVAGQYTVRGLPRHVTLSIGSAHVAVFDAQQPPLAYASAFRGTCAAVTMCTLGVSGQSADDQLRRWVPPSQVMAATLEGVARAHGRDPVVFFAVQDPLFNTNTVDLDYALAYGSALPTGLLQDPATAGRSIVDQLNAPALGRPNLVISGPLSAVPAAQAFAPQLDASAVELALRTDGFAVVSQLVLPDGRLMQVWWHGGRGRVHRG